MRKGLSSWAWILGAPLFAATATHCSSSTQSKSTADASQTGGPSGGSSATGGGGRATDGADLDATKDVPMPSDGAPSGEGGAPTPVDADRGGGATGTGGMRATGGATTIDGPPTTRPYSTGGVGASGGDASTGGVASSGGITGTGGISGDDGGAAVAAGPCDIYAAANTPCAAAYSMTRVLSSGYKGPLYQVRSGSSSSNTGTGGTTKDIGATPDGYADSVTQDDFCLATSCTVSVLYDQSGNGNHLKVAPKGPAVGDQGLAFNYESSATKGTVSAGGHRVHSLYMAAHEGYRFTAQGVGMPVGDAAQGIYELADGTHSSTDSGECCWDFGNAMIAPAEWGYSTALYFGTPYSPKGEGSGPWFMADLNGVLWAGGSKRSEDPWGAAGSPAPPASSGSPSMKVPFALGFLKTSKSKYMIRVADVQGAAEPITTYDGAIPQVTKNEGGIVLGTGSDNYNTAWGTFYEGAITSGYPTSETDLAVLKNVQAVGYRR